ncbi:MAG: acyltransferase [Chitinophagaceae bacterium]
MQKRLYNLDGLRFMAAWVVLLCHIEGIKSLMGIKGIRFHFHENAGLVAVTFFFVLSGFLITYLLLEEKKLSTSSRIDLLRFYKKRIVRIWPLYYLLVLLVFVVIRQYPTFYNSLSGYSTPVNEQLLQNRLLGYVFFLPNYTDYNFGNEFYLGQTWTLGVEEFFYLFFPLLIYFTKLRYVKKMLLIIGLALLLFSLSIYFLFQRLDHSHTINILAFYFDRYRIYSFVLGGLAASLLVLPTEKKLPWIGILKNKVISKGLLFMALILIVMGVTFLFITQQLYSVLFAFFLYSVTGSGIRFYFLNHPAIVYLGKISYGIYLFQPLTIVIFLKLVRPDDGTDPLTAILLIAGITIATIAAAAISYELFEKFFLRLGKKKAVIE